MESFTKKANALESEKATPKALEILETANAIILRSGKELTKENEQNKEGESISAQKEETMVQNTEIDYASLGLAELETEGKSSEIEDRELSRVPNHSVEESPQCLTSSIGQQKIDRANNNLAEFLPQE